MKRWSVSWWTTTLYAEFYFKETFFVTVFLRQRIISTVDEIRIFNFRSQEMAGHSPPPLIKTSNNSRQTSSAAKWGYLVRSTETFDRLLGISSRLLMAIKSMLRANTIKKGIQNIHKRHQWTLSWISSILHLHTYYFKTNIFLLYPRLPRGFRPYTS